MRVLILLGVIFCLASTFVASFDLSDALLGHITDDMTTTEKPSKVVATADFSDDDLLAVIAESNKKNSKATGAVEKKNLITIVKKMLEAIAWKVLPQPIARILMINYKKASDSILQWIGQIKDTNKISPCFDKIDSTFSKIIQDTAASFVKNANLAQKSYNEKLTNALKAIRQCIISKLKP